VLKKLHDGEVTAAAQQLDLVLCDSILQINSEMGSADERTRAYVRDAFRRMARVRPKILEVSPGTAGPEATDDQLVAQQILMVAMVDDEPSK
jgi:hypothetical protein